MAASGENQDEQYINIDDLNILDDEGDEFLDVTEDDSQIDIDRLSKEQIEVELDETDVYHALQFTLSLLSNEQPEFEWKEEDIVHSIPSFCPSGPPGAKRCEAPGSKAVDYFNLFFDENLLQSIVDLTNLNASHQMQNDKENKSSSWQDLTIKELQAYIGVRILIEILYKDRIEELWRLNPDWPLLQPVGLTKIFPRDRFTQISRYLHFCDEEKAAPRESVDYDKLYKIRPLLNHLRQRFKEEYIPNKEVSIDECMIPFRGRLGFKQYCKDKPVKFGVKTFMLADSTNGYNFNFEVYCGKEGTNLLGMTSRVVVSLLQPLFEQGYEVYTDRFYTSPTLLFYLAKVGLTGCGTVMCNKKGFPQELKRTSHEMKQGDFEWRVCTKTGIVATVWADKRPIYFLSSAHVPIVKGLQVRRKDGKGSAVMVDAPPSVVQYNQYMGGVDTNDRFTALDKRRKQYRWYTRLFRKCIMWSLYNAFILEGYFVEHTPTGKRKRDFRSFTLDVAHQLIGNYTSRKRKLGRPSLTGNSRKRLTDSDHFPVVGEGNDHRCVVCTEKNRSFSRSNPGAKSPVSVCKTSFMCSSANCQVYLCIKRGSSCWEKWHTKIEYWH